MAYQGQTSSVSLSRALAEKPTPEDQNLPSAHEAGVGLLFRRDNMGRNAVHAIIPHSPAFDAGVIAVGDVLIQVDGESTSDISLQKLRNKIVGAAGSCVSLSFARESNGKEGRYEVDLIRRRIDAVREGERSLMELEEELKTVRQQAIDETKARATAEQTRRELELQLRKTQQERHVAEENLEFVMEELRRNHELYETIQQAWEEEQLAMQNAKSDLEERLFDADSRRSAAEYTLRKQRRDGFCFPWGKSS